MPNTPEDLHVSQLAHGAALALANAVDLFQEAETLFSCKAYSRCLFLHQISLEECGKIEILGGLAAGRLMGHTFKTKEVKSNLASHKTKNFANAYMLPVSEAEQIARQTSDWSTARQTFNEQKTEHHNKSNNRKNSALYVDFNDGIFHSPAEKITEDMCHEIATMNAEFIQLVSLKVAMLGRWAEDTESARSTLLEFQARIEELDAKHPSEPQRALDQVLEDMLTKAKEQRAQQP